MNSNILIAQSFGPASVLEFFTQELSPLKSGMARIQVKASGINPIDARRMTGEFKHAGLPQTFGTEFSGIIIALDDQASNWAIGDEVLGSGGAFTHATVIDVPLGNLIARPKNLSWEIAGSIPGVAQTAMTILDEIGPVKSLLIHGGSGGVGSIAIQIAKERGIDVVATASAKNQSYLESLGATAVVYGPGLTERLQAIHPAAFDASVDMVGTEEATQAALATVSTTGIIATIAGIPVSSSRVQSIWVKRNTGNLKFVVEGVAEGRFTWEIDKTFPFAQAADAYNHILEGHTRGKNVLTF